MRSAVFKISTLMLACLLIQSAKANKFNELNEVEAVSNSLICSQLVNSESMGNCSGIIRGRCPEGLKDGSTCWGVLIRDCRNARDQMTCMGIVGEKCDMATDRTLCEVTVRECKKKPEGYCLLDIDSIAQDDTERSIQYKPNWLTRAVSGLSRRLFNYDGEQVRAQERQELRNRIERLRREGRTSRQ